ncbi:MAG: hypothetical protein OXR84_11300 [Magnetovibrio sp.]|nr:hypothetical protein [Magnetovibrio sp.]
MGNLVINSIETPEGDRCVDLFRRADGTHGFEVYRRDAESLTGWYAIGGFADRTYASQAEARAAAVRVAPWIPEDSA